MDGAGERLTFGQYREAIRQIGDIVLARHVTHLIDLEVGQRLRGVGDAHPVSSGRFVDHAECFPQNARIVSVGASL